ENVDRGHFISLIFGVLDLTAQKMTVARAGHDPILWYRPQDDFFKRLLPPGIALGLEPGEIFDDIIKEECIAVQPGDLFVLYTDGFSEAMNQYATEFSEERLVQSIRRCADLPAEEILVKIKTQVAHFVGHSPQHDDMTMIIMRILPT
ncbi:MAG TPA: PP2C family protein-serine/threonine phosphatase, partial [bacterium]|nr:PP2C family protein-serine/threonine phosphatase [bacterium]